MTHRELYELRQLRRIPYGQRTDAQRTRYFRLALQFAREALERGAGLPRLSYAQRVAPRNKP